MEFLLEHWIKIVVVCIGYAVNIGIYILAVMNNPTGNNLGLDFWEKVMFAVPFGPLLVPFIAFILGPWLGVFILFVLLNGCSLADYHWSSNANYDRRHASVMYGNGAKVYCTELINEDWMEIGDDKPTQIEKGYQEWNSRINNCENVYWNKFCSMASPSYKTGRFVSNKYTEKDKRNCHLRGFK